MTPRLALMILWFVWIVSWVAAAFWSDRAAKRPGIGAELVYRIVTIVGGVLLFGVARLGRLTALLWYVNNDVGWAFFAAAVVGFVFAWWARLHLGRLWSGWVSKKADHRIVDTGPYGMVRHPIYTGIILAVLATAAAKATLIALAGALLMIAGFWIKARLEERFLRQELGADAYDAYRRRVPMLIPFSPA